MEITARKEKGAIVVAVKGRMDAITAPDFEKHLGDLIAAGERKFIVDLSELEYISSAGLRSILVIAKRLKADHGDIRFAGMRGAVEEVFKISGFHSIFKIFPTWEAALV